MDRWKAEQGRGREKRKSKKKEVTDARKGRKVAKHCVFPMIWGSGGSKSRLAKAAGAERAGQMRDEKLHAVVARSTFPSQNVQNTPRSDHFWQLRCRKSARRRGAKQISKSKCTKHTTFWPLLAVEMSKKCTPSWREAHFEVKMYKTHHVRTTFGGSDVEKVHAVVARSTFWSQNFKNTRASDHFWRFRCRKSACRCRAKHISKSNVQNKRGSDLFWRFRCRFASLHYITLHLHSTTLLYRTLHCTTLQYTTLHYTPVHSITLNYTTPHYITLHYTTLRSTTYTTLHYATLHYTTLHHITLHYTTLHYTTLHYTTLSSTTLHYLTLHTLHSITPQLQLQLHNYIPLHSSTLHYTKLHYTTLHYTTLHYTTLHHITLHYTTLHYTTLHYTTISSTTLHYLTLHYTPLHHNYNYNCTTTLHYTPLH